MSELQLINKIVIELQHESEGYLLFPASDFDVGYGTALAEVADRLLHDLEGDK